MREIKFRAWNKEMKVMCYDNEDNSKEYFDGIRMSEIGFINDRLSVPDKDDSWSYRARYEVMQYTGLKDKNGQKIFEGDIVNFVYFDTTGGHRDDREYKGVVKFQSGIYEIWRNNDSEFFESDGPFILNHAWLQDDEFEVIGNIYEHPHLLQEGDSHENQ